MFGSRLESRCIVVWGVHAGPQNCFGCCLVRTRCYPVIVFLLEVPYDLLEYTQIVLLSTCILKGNLDFESAWTFSPCIFVPSFSSSLVGVYSTSSQHAVTSSIEIYQEDVVRGTYWSEV